MTPDPATRAREIREALQKAGWLRHVIDTDAVEEVIAAALTALAKARRERDEALGDLAVYRAANLTCGQSPTTVSLGMAPTRTQGCGLGIADGKDVFRCRDCEVPFHRSCLNRHCDDELATEREALAEARRALEGLLTDVRARENKTGQVHASASVKNAALGALGRPAPDGETPA